MRKRSFINQKEKAQTQKPPADPSYLNRNRLMKYNKYLTNPAIIAGLAGLVFFVSMLLVNVLINGAEGLMRHRAFHFFAYAFGFRMQYRLILYAFSFP